MHASIIARCINHSYVAGGTAHKLLCMLIFVACCYAPKIFILQFSYLDIFCGSVVQYSMLTWHYIHVLVCPRREVKRFVDLTVDETSDLWLTAQKIGSQLESYHKASSLTFSIQVRPMLVDQIIYFYRISLILSSSFFHFSLTSIGYFLQNV